MSPDASHAAPSSIPERPSVLLGRQTCGALADAASREWLVTSEWESIDDFYDWEATDKHRDQARPMRECMEEARSHKFVVREETVGAGRDR